MSDGRVGGRPRAGVRISHICAACFLGLSVSAMVHMQASWWAVLVSCLGEEGPSQRLVS